MSINGCFRILGRFQACLDGSFSTDWAQPKTRAIVAALLIQPGRPVSRDTLLDWAWGPNEKRPGDLDSTFHTYVQRIRTALSHLDEEVKLVSRSRHLHLEIDRNLVDYHRFRELAQHARTAGKAGDHARSRDLAAEGLRLWQPEGPLFDIESERADNWRRQVIADEWIPANNLLLQQLLALGDLDEALTLLNDLGDEQGSHLALMKRRIETLYRLGRSDDAKAYYFTTRKALRADNDEAQAEDLRGFHDRIARWDTAPTSEPAGIPADSAVAAHGSVSQLPPDIGDFVGREIVLTKLHELVARTRDHARAACVVFDGLAGVGKTALAVHWAHDALGNSDLISSAIYLNLNGFSSGPRIEVTEAIDELLHALDYPVDQLITPARRAAKLRDLVAGKQTLIILDNIQNSGHIRPLIPLISHGTIVMISRQRLTGLTATYGVIHFTVPPLHQRDAAELLTGRIGARAVREPHVVNQLTTLCGGLPLALQLVAHHIGADEDSPLPEFVTELNDHARLLGIGDDGDDPDASLRATFSFSYLALPPREQRLFRLLGLHPGPSISLHAAAAIAGEDLRQAQRGLDVLTAAHLLDRLEAAGRYRFHDLLRSFSAELAAASEHAAESAKAQVRLLSFYLHTTFNSDRQLFPFRVPVPMLPLEDGVVPIVFSSDATAASWILRERSNATSIVRWSFSRGQNRYAWRIPHNLYGVYRRYAFYDELRAIYEIAVSSVQLCRDLESEGATRNDLGKIYLSLGDYERSGVQFHMSAGIAQQTHSEIGIAVSQLQLASQDESTGRLDDAIGLCRRALERAIQIGNVALQSAVLHQIGDTFQKKGQFGEAIVEYQQALRLRDSIDNRHGQAQTLTELGAALGELGDYSVALAHCHRALAIVEQIHDSELAPRTCVVLAVLHHRRGANAIAVFYARTAVRLARTLRNSAIEAPSLDVLARALHDMDFHEAAFEGWVQARAIYADFGRLSLVHRIDADLADLTSAQRNVPQARTTSSQESSRSNTAVENGSHGHLRNSGFEADASNELPEGVSPGDGSTG